MKSSELIEKLQQSIVEHGDLDVSLDISCHYCKRSILYDNVYAETQDRGGPIKLFEIRNFIY